MSTSSSWDVIFGADSGQTVLGVDFPAGRHPEAGFGKLAARIGPAYRFLQTKQPLTFSARKINYGDYVCPWIEDIRQGRRQVLAVFGYCVGSVYAAAIAEGISQWQQPPYIILFDPQFASMRLLARELLREIKATSSILSGDEIRRAEELAAGLTAAKIGDVTEAAGEMVESYFSIITPAFERVGLGNARGNELTKAFEGYISWICAAGEIDPSDAWKDSTAILSLEYAGQSAVRPTTGDACGLIGRRISFAVNRADLLRSDSVAETVLELLQSRQCGPLLKRRLPTLQRE